MKKYLLILFALFIAAGCSNNDSSDSGTNPAPIKTTVLMYIEGTTYEQPETAKIFFSNAYNSGIKTDALGHGPANYMIKGMIENLNPENTNIVVQTGSTDDNMKWTDEEIRLFRKNSRRHNICIRTRSNWHSNKVERGKIDKDLVKHLHNCSLKEVKTVLDDVWVLTDYNGVPNN